MSIGPVPGQDLAQPQQQYGSATGNVTGPGAAVNNDIAVFDGVTGKIIKDGGSTIAAITAGTVPVTRTVNGHPLSADVVVTQGDVGLGNVDNTSDATKNAAVATLTNKTLTTPVINSPTGLVKADVGLGNVDNTSDVTKNAAAVTLTNKTIASPALTGVPTAPTAAPGTNTTQVATTAFVAAAVTVQTGQDGTWVPVDNSGAGLVFSVTSASYTKTKTSTGYRIQGDLAMQYPVTADTSVAAIGGIPGTTVNNGGATVGFSTAVSGININIYVQGAGANQLRIVFSTNGTNVQNFQLSSATLIVSFDYFSST